jgi:hypothetical protein
LSAAANPPPLSEEEVREISQRWAWEASAPIPERSENRTLHFTDHPDVRDPFNFNVNSSSLRILLPRRSFDKAHLGDPTTVQYTPKPSPPPSPPTTLTSLKHGSLTSYLQRT